MKQIILLLCMLCCLCSLHATEFTELAVDFPRVASFSEDSGYGYDLGTAWDGRSSAPFFFSVNVPDGNYRVTVTLGSRKRAAHTTVRCECRRLMVENVVTRKGERVTRTFVVNKRNTLFTDADGHEQVVKIKDSERGYLHWDDKLTFEINGDAPAIERIEIVRDDQVPTFYLIGNSTVVDQSVEPWASWGQMIPRFLNDQIAVANYAESGMAVASFIGQNRWAKIFSRLKAGDYVVLEFGHNDQKADDRPGNGAYYAFSHQVKQILDQCRQKGATFLLCTPTKRRSFEGSVVVNTHKDYPAAIRDIAKREGLLCIDLQELTGRFYEAMGPEESKRAFVHYPAGTWPNQTKALADNTHFNPYGAYQIAKMVAHGLLHSDLGLAQYVLPEVADYDPSHPDPIDSFHWSNCPFTGLVKPDGN